MRPTIQIQPSCTVVTSCTRSHSALTRRSHTRRCPAVAALRYGKGHDKHREAREPDLSVSAPPGQTLGEEAQEGLHASAPPEAPPGFNRQGGQQQYQQYYQPYQGYYPPPPPAPAAPSGGLPWWLLLALGFALAKGLDLLNFFRGGGLGGALGGAPGGANPQSRMMQQMMEQAMKQMQDQPGGGMPFPGPSGFPSPPGFGGGGGFTPPSPASAPSTPAGPTYETTAKPAGGSAPSATQAQVASPSKPAEVPLVQPEVKAPESPPAASSSPSPSAPRQPPKRSAFVDVDEVASTSQNGSSAPWGASPSPGAASPGPASSEDFSEDELVAVLQNPQMQKAFAEYLPENMRSPEHFEWMLKTPEFRKNMVQQMKQMGVSPAMMRAMTQQGTEEANAQLQQLGMTQQELIAKMSERPELVSSMMKPHVLKAITEMQSNPMAIFKYQQDPEVSKVLEEFAQIFPQFTAPDGAAAPFMPPTAAL